MIKITLKHLFIYLCIVLSIIGCDDPASSDQVHIKASGFTLENESSNKVYSQFVGGSTGSITISVGDTLELIVYFLDGNGKKIEHEESEESEHEDELKITGNDNLIATIEVEEHCEEITDQTECVASDHCEWHADEGACEVEGHDNHDHNEEEEEHHEMRIIIIGVSEGSTSFKIELWHGDHDDFTSYNNVPITVNEQI